MGLIKEQIKNELKLKIREQIAQKNQKIIPIKKTTGGFISNIGKNITGLAKGIVGLGYQVIRHPIESVKGISAAGLELAKAAPKTAKIITKTYAHPIKTITTGVSAYKKLRDIPFEEQKKFFNEATEKFIQSDERGKRVLGAFGAGFWGATLQEISHPAQYAYENPVYFALDVLALSKVTGINKIVSSTAKTAVEKIPAVTKIKTAMTEVFTPNGKLIVAGYDDLAKDLTKTKSNIFKIQKEIVENTTNKFYKEFKLTPDEQTKFFNTIDELRRVKPQEITPKIKITSELTKRSGDVKVLEINVDGVNVANAIFGKDKGRGALSGTYHTPEFRWLDKTGNRQSRVLVGDTIENLSLPESLEMRLKNFGILDEIKPTGTLAGEIKKITAVKATSANPKIQQAINWWLDEEAPKLAIAAGLPEEKIIQNYLHHFFPEKFKGKEVALTKPMQYAKKGYLKKSRDVEGFTKDPVLSISAIKSKIAIDNLRDGFITNTINKYAVKTDTLAQKLTEAGVDIKGFDKTALIEKAKQILGLEEYKPKGSLRFFPATTETGGKIIGATKKVETHLMPKIIVDELNKFAGGGKDVLNKLFLPFDIFNRNWKPLATAVRPRYHTRNILGNIYNSTVVAGNNPISFVLRDLPIAGYQQIKTVISKSIKNQTLMGKVYQKFFGDVLEPEIIKLAVDNDIVGRGFFGADLNDLVLAYDKGDDIMKTIKNINTPAEIYKVPILKQWLQTSTKVGQFLEDNARLALFKQGLKKFGGNIDDAKFYVNKHLFDYLTGLGEADKIIKRFIPFWSWTRFNIPLQASSLIKTPLRYAAIQRTTEPYKKQVELTDEGYQYLTEEQQLAGFIKTGTTIKGDKEYDKYIKTASVLPLDDLSRLADILRGKDEEIGITPLKQIYDLITKDPTKFKTYFGQPVESFTGEKKKFLGIGIRGRTKELLSTIPLLTEINKLIGGGYMKDEKPEKIIRVEQVLSPLGISLVDKESNKFFFQLEKEKELTGSYTAGLQQIYKKYLKIDMERKGQEKYISDNIKILEKILKQKGLNDLDLLKIKNNAIKALLQDIFKSTAVKPTIKPTEKTITAKEQRTEKAKNLINEMIESGQATTSF